MNWDAIGALAETLGALAVLITLVYLSIQIRQNTSSTKAIFRQNVFESHLGINKVVLENSELRDLLFLVTSGEPLNAEQKFHWGIYMYNLVRVAENAYRQFIDEHYTEQDWKLAKLAFVRFFKIDGVGSAFQESYDWWETNKYLYHPGFVKEIDMDILQHQSGSDLPSDNANT